MCSRMPFEKRFVAFLVQLTSVTTSWYSVQHKNLEATFERLRQCGLTLNRNKCAYYKGTLDFFGYVITKGGVTADSNNISAIQNLDTPSNATQVRSLLGISNFCARFIPGCGVRELMKKDAQWTWTGVQQVSGCNTPVTIKRPGTCILQRTEGNTDLRRC